MPAEVIHDFSMQDTRTIDNIADAVQQIKDCFIADGWVHSITPQAQMMQEMSNLHARMKAEMIRLGMTSTPQKRASGDK